MPSALSTPMVPASITTSAASITTSAASALESEIAELTLQTTALHAENNSKLLALGDIVFLMELETAELQRGLVALKILMSSLSSSL